MGKVVSLRAVRKKKSVQKQRHKDVAKDRAVLLATQLLEAVREREYLEDSGHVD